MMIGGERKSASKHFRLQSLTTGLAFAFLSAQAVAAESGGGQEAAHAAQLEEIIVTSQKRSENLQSVPIAITAFSGAYIENFRINNVQDIAIRTPGFVIGQRNPADPDITIRGIGSNEPHAGSDRSVIVSVDDVAISRGGGSVFELFDIERIEVLRGPQGTLSGRNAVGGAINIITRRPSEEYEAKGKLSYGNRQLMEGKGYVSGPISDDKTLLGKLVVSAKNQDGYNTSAITGESLRDTESVGVRAQILYEPAGDFELLLTAEAAHDRVDGTAVKLSPAGVLFTSTTINFTPSDDPYLLEDDYFGKFKRNLRGLSGRLSWQTDVGEVVSITAYREYDLRNAQNLTGAPLGSDYDPITGEATGFRSVEDANEDNMQISQELRLSSMDEGPLTWVAGLYFFHEETDRLVNFERSIRTSNSAPTADQRVNTDSYAAFGQVTWHVTDRLNFTVGGRYTKDKKKLGLTVTDRSNGTSDTLAPFLETYDVSAKDSFEAFTPKAAIDFNVNDNAMIYASASRGYKSGGFLGVAGAASEAVKSFEPEFAWNYEIGAKTRWFDNRLQLNIAGFYTDFTDLQVRQRVLAIPGNEASAVSVVRNAADAKIKGIEMEVLTRPLPGLTLSGSYSYLKTEFKNFGASTGNVLPRSPKNSFSVSGDYSFPIAESLNGYIRSSYSWRDDFYYDDAMSESGHEQSYGLLDGSIGIETEDGNWALEIWARNLTDKVYRTFVQPVGDSGLSTFGEPRTYGLSIIHRFGS